VTNDEGSQDASAGGRVIGRYLLCDAIASGGMATVHLGQLLGPVGFSRTVAIKRLHPHFARDPEFVAMFLDEARLAARIRHPNVVSTLDVVVLQGELFVVMDYVHGEALSKLIRTSGALPPSIAASLIAGVLYGLHAAHEAKTDDGAPLRIVHRDVSPQNVLVGVDGTARVVDFGVAKAVGRLQTTREGALKGKIAYMSPEQISTDTVDRRTDIYAASVVLWEMLTGKRLFQADNEVRVIQKVLSGQIQPPSKLAAVPRELDALVMKGLARDPNERFATAYEMAEQVQRIAFATPGQVSEWVQKLSAQTIEQRAKKIAEVESRIETPEDDDRTEASEPSDAMGPRIDATRLSAPVLAALSNEAIGSAPVPIEAAKVDSQVSALNVSSSAWQRPAWFGRVGRLVVALGVGLGTLLIGGVVLMFLVRSAHDSTSTAPTAAAPTAASAPLATSPAPSPPATTSAASSEPAPRPVPAASTAPAATTEHAHATAPPQHGPANAPHARPSCNPPYTIKDGIRIPKMECL
jgi:serine/threonine protein kinase